MSSSDIDQNQFVLHRDKPLGVKIQYMVIRFYCVHQSYKKRIAPIRGLLSGHHVQEAIEVLQTIFR
jgi:hypothetical protein